MPETITRREIAQVFKERGFTVSIRTLKRYPLRWLNEPETPKLFDRAEAMALVERTIALKQVQRDAQERERQRKAAVERWRQERREKGIANRAIKAYKSKQYRLRLEKLRLAREERERHRAAVKAARKAGVA